MTARHPFPVRNFPAIALAIWLLLPSLHAAIKTEEIPELKAPQGRIPEEFEQRSYLPWIVVGACVAGAVAVLLWGRKSVPVVTETPYARAARELNALQQPDPVVIGTIVRRYITETFPNPGPGQTFEELAALLARDPRWTPALRERLRLLIDPLEIAKFAPPGNAADLKRLREDASTLLADLDALQRPPVNSLA
jgi:hypothetical protein